MVTKATKNAKRTRRLAALVGALGALAVAAWGVSSCAAKAEVSPAWAAPSPDLPAGEYLQKLGTAIPASFSAKATALPDNPTDAQTEAYRDAISNTFVFAGASNAVPDWGRSGDLKNFVNLFEDNVRDINADYSDAQSVLSTAGRLVINAAKTGDGVSDVLKRLQQGGAIAALDPKNVVYVVGGDGSDASLDAAYSATYKQGVKDIIDAGLQLRNGTANVILMQAWKGTNNGADQRNADFGAAVQEWYEQQPAGTRDAAAARVQVVSVADYAAASQGMSGALAADNAMAKALYDKLNADASKPYAEIEPATDLAVSSPSGSLGTNSGKIGYVWIKDATPDDASDHLVSLYLALDALDFSAGQAVTWQAYYPELGLTVSDDAVLEDQDWAAGQGVMVVDGELGLEIPQLPTAPASASGPSSAQKVQITVLDPDGRKYAVWSGTLADTDRPTYVDNALLAGGSGNLAGNTSWTTEMDATKLQTLFTSLSGAGAACNTLEAAQLPQQANFMAKFNDKTKPMTWLFLGSTPDVRSGDNDAGTLAFDNYAQAIEKSVKGEWGRADDVFVNAATVGNFLNRAADPNVLAAQAVKYDADVVVLSFGITEMIDTSAGDNPFTAEPLSYQDTTTTNDANPNGSAGIILDKLAAMLKALGNGASPFLVVNPVAPTADLDSGAYLFASGGKAVSTQPGNKSNVAGLGAASGQPGSGQLATVGVANWYNNYYYTKAFGDTGYAAATWGRNNVGNANLLFNRAQNDLLAAAYAPLYEWVGQYPPFMTGDLLPGPNAHLAKARSVLGTLGVNVMASVLRDCRLERPALTAAQNASGTAALDPGARPRLAAGRGTSALFAVSGGAGYTFAPAGSPSGAQAISAPDAFCLYLNRITYAAQGYVNGGAAAGAGIGFGRLALTVPESAWSATEGASAPRVYQIDWTPPRTGADDVGALANFAVYSSSDAGNAASYANLLVFGLPSGLANDDGTLPAGVSVSGSVLANAPQTAADGHEPDRAYAYPLGG